MANPGFMLARVTGPVKVSVNLRTASTNVWTELGYTSEGVETRLISPHRPVYSDRMGGSEGVPIDYQQMGQMAKVSLQLVEFNHNALLALKQAHNATADVATGVRTDITQGKISNLGCLITQKGASLQFILEGQKDTAELGGGAAITLTPMNFPNCVIDEDIVIPTGSKNSVVTMGFTAFPFVGWDTGNSGAGNTWLYNQSTTLISRLERYAS